MSSGPGSAEAAGGPDSAQEDGEGEHPAGLLLHINVWFCCWNYIKVNVVSQLKEQLMLMEAQLEKQVEEAGFTQSCREELVQV